MDRILAELSTKELVNKLSEIPESDADTRQDVIDILYTRGYRW